LPVRLRTRYRRRTAPVQSGDAAALETARRRGHATGTTRWFPPAFVVFFPDAPGEPPAAGRAAPPSRRGEAADCTGPVTIPPLRRTLLNLLAALSLLLLVAATVAWLRSYRHVDQVGRRATFASAGGHWVDEQFRGLVSDRGGLVALSAKRRANADGSAPPQAAARFEWRVDPRGWDAAYAKLSDPLLGFESNYKVSWSGTGGLLHDEWRWVRAPYWCVALVTAALPLYRLASSLRRRRNRPAADHAPA
jgi:hypothetical protein